MKYNPNTPYTWDVNEKFTITGGEFGLILNSLRAILSTEEASKILLAHRASEILEKLMQEGVEKGIIKESIKPEKDEKES